MSSGRSPALSLEMALLGFFSLTWGVAILAMLRLLPLAGIYEIDLYRLYSVAAVLGWMAGNVYVFRCRTLERRRYRKRLLLSYLIGPPSVVYILRALAPQAVQAAAPLVPIYAFAVYCIFFLVPVTLRASQPPRRRL